MKLNNTTILFIVLWLITAGGLGGLWLKTEHDLKKSNELYNTQLDMLGEQLKQQGDSLHNALIDSVGAINLRYELANKRQTVQINALNYQLKQNDKHYEELYSRISSVSNDSLSVILAELLSKVDTVPGR